MPKGKTYMTRSSGKAKHAGELAVGCYVPFGNAGNQIPDRLIPTLFQIILLRFVIKTHPNPKMVVTRMQKSDAATCGIHGCFTGINEGEKLLKKLAVENENQSQY